MPATFEVEDPEGYYQTVIYARLEKVADNAYWENAHRTQLRPMAAGGAEEDGGDPSVGLRQAASGGGGGGLGGGLAGAVGPGAGGRRRQGRSGQVSSPARGIVGVDRR